ncbi:hypothetical protein [Pseudobacteriovorax antillogorgiicola]|uniref:hypothetical protein n=1 Tax=Pseudobacteriovorax antillogorgiicola TaxID=1513793 RepID=UPI00117BAD88|nr:hypothetical protein [Pseudobacteriovorax antillogorgiicola]
MKILVVVLIFMDYASAKEEQVYLDSDNLVGQAVGTYTRWLQSEQSIFDITNGKHDNAFTDGDVAMINKNYTYDTYWYHVAIRNSDGSKVIYLHDPQSFYNVFQVFVDGKLVGDLDLKNSLQSRIVPISLKENQITDVFIKKNTEGLIHQSNWSFWTNLDDLKDHIHNSEKVFVALFTIYSMSFLITVLAFLSFRETIYFFYAGYLASFIVFLMNTWSVFYIPLITEYGANATTVRYVPGECETNLPID